MSNNIALLDVVGDFAECGDSWPINCKLTEKEA